MSKVFVIPDIHLKPWMLDTADKQISAGNYDTIVFLGDLVDDWDQQENIGLYEEIFDTLAEFIRKHPRFLYCYGNHDVSYKWKALETGYSNTARDTVLAGFKRIYDILPPEHFAYIHRIDNVLFSHAGLTEPFVRTFFPDHDLEFNDLLARINSFGKHEMWNNASPIWARPQPGHIKLYPEEFLQVVGHTPVRMPYYINHFLTVDTFSTYRNGTPIGDQLFVWVDTKSQTWGYADNNGSLKSE